MEAIDYSEEIDFHKYWLVFKRRFLPATLAFGGVFGLAAWYAFSQKTAYLAAAQLLLKTDNSSSLTGADNSTGTIDNVDRQSDALSTEVEIILSRPIIEKTIIALNLRDENGEFLSPEFILKELNVKPIPGTDILTISYESYDPTWAERIVNTLIKVYIENDIQTNRAEAVAARNFIEKQLPKVEATVSQSEADLRRFKEANKILDLQQEASITVGSIAKLEDKISQLQAQLAQINAESEGLRNKIGLDAQEAVAATSLSQSTGVQEALTQLQEIQAQLAVERTRFKDEYPTVAQLALQEAALLKLLQERIAQVIGSQQPAPPVKSLLEFGPIQQQLTAELVQSEVQRLGLKSQLAVLRNTQSSYKQRSRVLPKLEQNQRELERRVAAAQATYQILLSKLQETRVAENQNVGNARIISEAIVPEKPIPIPINLILAGGAFAGILVAIATAFLIDLLDRSVHTLKELKQLFRYTLLGVIPDYGKLVITSYFARSSQQNVFPIFPRDLPRSVVGEAYQILQANLKFISSDRPLQSIVVTSSVAKEGKSHVCANLAAAMAQVGRRVLLIDADLRYPSQHHLWELTNSLGLSDILVGEAKFNQAKREVMTGLDVLMAGVIPPNPVALLDSQKMALLMEKFSREYDCVIIDTPALAGMADAPILGKMADGILLVARPEKTDSASANAAMEILKSSGQNVLGLVTNGVIFKNEPDGYIYPNRENYTTPDFSQEKAECNQP
ncbi:polysaccharide biosynthesis tyrosine autokinase [Moorena sp. SIO3H5]|uniref:GumC family protein n=1 Tax=Moorena sp. SIO3H5 TaxID=2607834 RepID=UPI0013B9CB51|nr:polysaccharide biosynthesis tyrosine autokinase [Moorena sp. SIO3H5]NEO72747.1 polysaccharide biosynthesis tyrosine autokinase [Moorena sp. SIO3H5]